MATQAIINAKRDALNEIRKKVERVTFSPVSGGVGGTIIFRSDSDGVSHIAAWHVSHPRSGMSFVTLTDFGTDITVAEWITHEQPHVSVKQKLYCAIAAYLTKYEQGTAYKAEAQSDA